MAFSLQCHDATNTKSKANDESLHPTRVRTGAAETRTGSVRDSGGSHQDNPLKRKRPSSQPENADPKLQEFLNVMQAPSKSKAWKSVNAEAPQLLVKDTAAANEAEAEAEIEDGEPSDDEYQSIPKKHKVGSAHINDRNGSEEPLEFSNASRATRKAVDTSTQDDSNWLKSKTGQLLGLDESEEVEDDDAPRRSVQRARSSSVDSVGKGSKATDEAEKNETKADSPLAPIDAESTMDENEKQIRASKRLFLRNLPFTITEEALMDEFSSHGQIEEVCFAAFLQHIHHCMMNPDRDS